jgi:hypothetical protein
MTLTTAFLNFKSNEIQTVFLKISKQDSWHMVMTKRCFNYKMNCFGYKCYFTDKLEYEYIWPSTIKKFITIVIKIQFK